MDYKETKKPLIVDKQLRLQANGATGCTIAPTAHPAENPSHVLAGHSKKIPSRLSSPDVPVQLDELRIDHPLCLCPCLTDTIPAGIEDPAVTIGKNNIGRRHVVHCPGIGLPAAISHSWPEMGRAGRHSEPVSGGRNQSRS
jgi:hypothetical protein